MTDRPKPPEGYETNLDAVLKSVWGQAYYPRRSAAALAELAELRAEIKRLRKELADAYEVGFRQLAYQITEDDVKTGTRSDLIGWYDSMALSTACDFGDRLVELGLWERHPAVGAGRRHFYRPIAKGEDQNHD